MPRFLINANLGFGAISLAGCGMGGCACLRTKSSGVGRAGGPNHGASETETGN